VNYVGLWDDLSVFDHPLTDEEVAALYQLKEGVWYCTNESTRGRPAGPPYLELAAGHT